MASHTPTPNKTPAAATIRDRHYLVLWTARAVLGGTKTMFNTISFVHRIARAEHPIILPRTAAGRDMLRLILPAVDWATGRLPDDSSIYGCDWDEAAVEVERLNSACDKWLEERRI